MSMSFEQNPQEPGATTRAVVDRFNETFNRHDADPLALLLDQRHGVRGYVSRADGKRIEGKAAVVAFWREWFACSPGAQFEADEIIVSGDRCRCAVGVSQEPQRRTVDLHRATSSRTRRESGREARVCERVEPSTPPSLWVGLAVTSSWDDDCDAAPTRPPRSVSPSAASPSLPWRHRFRRPALPV